MFDVIIVGSAMYTCIRQLVLIVVTVRLVNMLVNCSLNASQRK